jgi:hypothetical protein
MPASGGCGLRGGRGPVREALPCGAVGVGSTGDYLPRRNSPGLRNRLDGLRDVRSRAGRCELTTLTRRQRRRTGADATTSPGRVPKRTRRRQGKTSDGDGTRRHQASTRSHDTQPPSVGWFNDLRRQHLSRTRVHRQGHQAGKRCPSNWTVGLDTSAGANRDFTYPCSAADRAASCSDCRARRDWRHADPRDPACCPARMTATDRRDRWGRSRREERQGSSLCPPRARLPDHCSPPLFKYRDALIGVSARQAPCAPFRRPFRPAGPTRGFRCSSRTPSSRRSSRPAR